MTRSSEKFCAKKVGGFYKQLDPVLHVEIRKKNPLTKLCTWDKKICMYKGESKQFSFDPLFRSVDGGAPS